MELLWGPKGYVSFQSTLRSEGEILGPDWWGKWSEALQELTSWVS